MNQVQIRGYQSIKERLKDLRENYYLQSLQEQDPENQAQPQQPMIPAGADMTGQGGQMPQDMSQMDPNMAAQMGTMDPTMMGGGDAGMSGMMPGGGMMGAPYEPPKTATQLGRIYELNKIYTRLYVIHKILSSVSDPKLQKIRDMTSEAFEIYRLILNNIKSYEGIIDDIILKYYEFLTELVKVLDIYFKVNSEQDEETKSNNRETRLSNSQNEDNDQHKSAVDDLAKPLTEK